jgi:prepilin peptidase CpaA
MDYLAATFQSFETPARAALWFLPFAALIALWVGWTDLTRMKIPNNAVLALFGVFVIAGFFVLPLADWGWRWAHMAVVLVLGFVVSALGAMGAGDAKFMAAMAPFVALGDLGKYMMILAFSALASLILFFAIRAVPGVKAAMAEWESSKGIQSISRVAKAHFPYGVPLGLSLVLYLALAASA